jgi:hypothetical protein
MSREGLAPNTWFTRKIGEVGEIEVAAHVPDKCDYVGKVTILTVGVPGDAHVTPEEAGFNAKIVSDLRRAALEESKNPRSALKPAEGPGQSPGDAEDDDIPW